MFTKTVCVITISVRIIYLHITNYCKQIAKQEMDTVVM